jgi:hypothetical protein
MHRIGKMDYRMKRRMGIISFLPLFAYIGWLVQYLIIMRSLIARGVMEDHMRMTGLLSQNFSGTLFFFLLCFIITAAVLIFFVIHIARLATMNSFSKLGWIVFMTFLAPVAFPIFWYTEVRHEPEQLPMHPDIA